MPKITNKCNFESFSLDDNSFSPDMRLLDPRDNNVRHGVEEL